MHSPLQQLRHKQPCVVRGGGKAEDGRCEKPSTAPKLTETLFRPSGLDFVHTTAPNKRVAAPCSSILTLCVSVGAAVGSGGTVAENELMGFLTACGVVSLHALDRIVAGGEGKF